MCFMYSRSSVFFFDVPEMMTLITTTLVTSLSFGGWESSPTDVALYPSDDTNGILRRRCGERTCWGVSFLDREQGSGGARNLFFFGFQRETWEHQDLFAGWWFGTFGLFFHILGMSSSQLTFIFFRGVGKPPTSLYLHSLYKEALVMVGWCPSRPIPWPWHIWSFRSHGGYPQSSEVSKKTGVPPVLIHFF